MILLINLVSFVLYGLDKWKAINGRWRIPEAVLLAFTALGGSAGALLAMVLFRHKIRKPKFRYGVPALLALHVVLMIIIH